MGKIHRPVKVKLFCGVLIAADYPWAPVQEELAARFGPPDSGAGPLDFTFTDYYQAEMGPAIQRRFVSFPALVEPEVLPAVKIATNRLEDELAPRGTGSVPRPVNLDPGYLEQGKVVLASTKNYYHRLYLRDGIWAEVTLYYQARHWRAFPWTFPDFQSPAYQEYFTRLRTIYRRQLRATDDDRDTVRLPRPSAGHPGPEARG